MKIDDKKIQAFWKENKVFKTPNKSSNNYYCLDMFPYPSGDGLHVGHVKGYSASDIISRYAKMKGMNVLHPMGWDAFGLPAENYAIKMGQHPEEAVNKNIIKFKNQLQSLGYCYDWSREINTTDPKYYKWTQWIFLKLFERGLAYETRAPINFCPSCKTGLANEEVISGLCERCSTKVEKKNIRQWVLKITAYADRLLEDLDDLDWPEPIKLMQKNWIGKSEGSSIDFGIVDKKANKIDTVSVFTTRADTLFGCTYVVLAPDSDLTHRLKAKSSNPEEINSYIELIKNKSDLERTDLTKDKTGVCVEGVWAINPINNEKIPVFVADYVLGHYGTGAVMAVPAHDERDFEFALKYNLPITSVIKPQNTTKSVVVGPSVEEGFKDSLKTAKIDFCIGTSSNGREHIRVTLTDNKIDEYAKLVQKFIKEKWWVETVGTKNLFITKEKIIEEFFSKGQEVFKLCKKLEPLVREDKNIWEMLGTNKHYKDLVCYIKKGTLYNSGEFNGLDSITAKTRITKKLKNKKCGDFAINYKLRDWIFSRQRYWGEPIPVIHCEKCGIVPVPEKQLPVELPNIEKYEPSGTGESPLVNVPEWVNVKCPKCDGNAKRETNTMPQWAGSCWYYLRFIDPTENKTLCTKTAEKSFMPVDLYIGGAEHAVLHLLYARFWHKVLFDIGSVSGKEPFRKLRNVGLILAADGQKMSKSRGNVINPSEIINKFGADSLKMYEMFIGPFDQPAIFNTNGLIGVKKFLDKVIESFDKRHSEHDIIKKGTTSQKLSSLTFSITNKIEKMAFNTAVSDFMKFSNEVSLTSLDDNQWKTFLKLLAPFASHTAETLWLELGEKESIFLNSWPKKEKIEDQNTIYIVQVNGKRITQIVLALELKADDVEAVALGNAVVKKSLKQKNIKRVVFIKNKVINFVI